MLEKVNVKIVISFVGVYVVIVIGFGFVIG